MLLRTIIFFVVIYFLIKIVSRLFLPSSQSQSRPRGRTSSGADFFHSVFNQMNQQSRQQNQGQSGNGSVKQRIDQIEEAEYEEIEEEEEEQSTGHK
ncbi:hypothetical protein ACG2F4_07755 [Halalkalibaculum sp. DA3122]|uniref:hypothetical protein n=1 Tax=unclassified Halalkalibaculum TaxID=2964617 RepID=UPI003754BCB9